MRFLKLILGFTNFNFRDNENTRVIKLFVVNLSLFLREFSNITSSGSNEDDVEQFANCGFQPAFSLVMKPSFYKLLPPGRHVGYDGTYTSHQPEWIANFSTGWSDGLARKLTNTGYVKRMKTGTK